MQSSTTVNDVAEAVPILAVTTAHGINVLGTTMPAHHHHHHHHHHHQDNDSSNNNNTDEEEPLLLLYECTKPQYVNKLETCKWKT
jgi:hypothetical protein